MPDLTSEGAALLIADVLGVDLEEVNVDADAAQYDPGSGDPGVGASVTLLVCGDPTVSAVYGAATGERGGFDRAALSAMLDVPASTLSFHLKELMHADLASVERDGRNLIYRASIGQMNALLAYLTDHCCQGAACTPARPRGRARC